MGALETWRRPLLSCEFIIMLQTPIGSNVAIQDIDIGIRVLFFDMKGVFDSRLAAYPGTV